MVKKIEVYTDSLSVTDVYVYCYEFLYLRHKKLAFCFWITEYPELEDIYKNHGAQLLAPRRTTQHSNRVSGCWAVLLSAPCRLRESAAPNVWFGEWTLVGRAEVGWTIASNWYTLPPHPHHPFPNTFCTSSIRELLLQALRCCRIAVKAAFF